MGSRSKEDARLSFLDAVKLLVIGARRVVPENEDDVVGQLQHRVDAEPIVAPVRVVHILPEVKRDTAGGKVLVELHNPAVEDARGLLSAVMRHKPVRLVKSDVEL